jgi:hypothetical protein
MQKHTTKLTSKSIERSGLPTDYKRAIAEYIWNGFDAKASKIEINFETNEIGTLLSFSIKDNGHGINMETLSESFGNFMVSMKNSSLSENSFVKGKKGKGRYSFFIFSNKATWETIYADKSGKLLEYKIELNKDSGQDYSTNNTIISRKKITGTEVYFENFTNLSGDLLDNDEFKNFLSDEFGWYLFLNKSENYEVSINGEPLQYKTIILDSDELSYDIDDWHFKVSFLQWERKISEKYYFYFLDSFKQQKNKQYTTFNNKAIDFHHSIYIESDFFNDFHKSINNEQLAIDGKTQAHPAFRKLFTNLTSLVAEKEKKFIKERKANELIEQYHKNNIFPPFKQNHYDQLRKEDLETVIKEIYTVQPKIFQGLTTPQKKTIVGFLNLLLDSEQREDVLEIMSSILTLEDKEKKDLADVLRKSHLTHITSLIKFLENRFTTVEILKTLVYELDKFTNEIDHIQKIIEDNYWLFGEQYHIVSADKNLETLLNNYLSFLENNKDKKPKIEVLEKTVKLKRPDVFICQQIETPDTTSDYSIQENIIVELKRPNVKIGKKQFSQIEDYLNYISNESRFNSKLRKWKFFLVGKNVDDYIKNLYSSHAIKNKKFLVQEIGSFEIYVVTWDDIFRIFEIKHNHLIGKLEFKTEIKEHLESKGISFDRKAVDELTKITLKKV